MDKPIGFTMKLNKLEIYQQCLSLVANGQSLPAGASGDFVRLYEQAKNDVDSIAPHLEGRRKNGE